MFRLLFFLFMVFLVFRALRYYLKIFMGHASFSKNKKTNSREIIDVDYEEVKDEKNANNKNK